MKKASTHILAAFGFVALFSTLPGTVYAHGSEHRSQAKISDEEHAFGRQGDPKKATRTIAIDMSDDMRFSPAEITVKQGETIRFVVRNKGKMLHEMVIGTMDELNAHAEMMRKHPGMEHDEPYMSHVSAGKKQTLVWQFSNAGEFYFACLIPGHFEAGMVGKIKVTKG
ncbi:cupredoxin family protein [Noviherbaspirillum sp.]|uniref:cupredoxin domain-containing protein n=1 Tax=Noviherbaspirillum sp. TaxID=1926288 RepID=UPI002D58CE86|nr:cupredoxin family protein [Noviherbaspirillum sp.]HZW20321.1 cupredoxin family protein [Noviherbaspirillum sp.]